MNDVLKVENLTKKYPKFTLDDISFQINPGKIMGLIGKNGAGKSTTIKAILNLVSPDNGSVYILDKPFSENETESKNNIGVVLGGIDYYMLKKIKTITKITSKFYDKWDHEAYLKYIKAFDLDEEKRVRELSSGMRVKYLLAIALSHDAKLLILDEPTSGLDPVAREDLLQLFKNLVKSGKRSILFSTHIITDLEKCADDITYIKDGKLLKSSGITEFKKYYQILKMKEDKDDIGLEEIMLRIERNEYNEEVFI